ncbi:MAG: 2-hydroxyacyl-CoA dehydratase subunit D [Myxococcaceae bacterium]
MRKSYIEAQRREHGRKVVAVLPVHYPKELLTAMDVLAVELWGPPGSPRGSDAGRLQAYVCSVVRNALGFLASGGADSVDAVLFPHTCDSIQGLATLAPDFGGWGKPTLRYLHPKGEWRPSVRAFVTGELASLASGLTALTGRKLDEEALRRAIALHAEIDALRAKLLEGRARLALDDRALYTLLRRGEFLWPAEHLAELQAAAAGLAAQPVQKGVPLMISGYVPEPMSLLDTLTQAGAYVCADDYAAVGRRVPREAQNLPEEPLAALAHLQFTTPPCPTRGASQSRRLDYLQALYDRGGARGLILHTVKFCEPELFDVPAIKAHFVARGVPVLSLEGELEAALSGQTATRVEAFVEMVAASRRAA